MMSCANIVVLRHIAKLSLSCVEKNMGRCFQLFVALLGNSEILRESGGESSKNWAFSELRARGGRGSTVAANEGSVVFEVGMGGVQKNPHFLRLEMGIVVNDTGVN